VRDKPGLRREKFLEERGGCRGCAGKREQEISFRFFAGLD